MSATVTADLHGGPYAPTSRTPRELAEGLLERGEALPASIDPAALRVVGWAIKDACYAAWSTEPQRAVRAAEALHGVALLARDPDIELEALVAWTAGIAHLTRGEMAQAMTRLDDAAARFLRIAKGHEAAQTQVPKIMALAMLGRHDEAVATAESAQQELVRYGDHSAAAKVSLNLGSSHLRRDCHARAAEDYRRAAVLFARAGDHQHSIMADIGIADALTAQGGFDEAVRIYARVRMRAEAHGFPVLSAMQAESVALLELARGNFARALAGFETSRRAYAALDMPQHLAIAEKQLADAYLELRLAPEAIAVFDDALARFEAQEMRDDAAWGLLQRGRAHALLRNMAGAAEGFAAAADMFAAQANTVGEAAVALARAELALASCDAAAALSHASSARRAFQQAGLRERALRAETAMAEALLELGSINEARDLFARVREQAQEGHVHALEVRCLTGEGMVALATEDAVSARSSFARAVELFEQQRRALPGDELREAFLTDHLRPYRGLLRISLDEHARANTAVSAARVLAELDRFRARALSERLAVRQRDADDDSTQQLRARVNWLRRRVTQLSEEGEAVGGPLSDLHRAESELLERARRQRLLNASTDASGSDYKVLDIATLQAHLAPADALVEYGVQDDELFACVVTRERIVVRRAVASWHGVQEALRSARFQLESLRHGDAPVAAHLAILAARTQARLQRLHALVWAPLAQDLEHAQRVLVVPHAELAVLPFCALHDGTAYLVERLEIAIMPSSRFAAADLACGAPAAPRNALVMGVSHRLPHAAREAAFVASLVPRATLAIDEDATLEAFVKQSADRELIHLACHAQFRSDNPLFSALHLNDGTLTAEAAEQLRLAGSTVVLSACETALAQQSAGDEMFGLVRAFLVAGARRVIATLWPVDDAATANLMRDFYRALLDGATCSQALCEAQRKLMRQSPHAAQWAGFTVFGGW